MRSASPNLVSILIKAAFGILLLNSLLSARAKFTDLQYNPHWYRTFDSTSDIIPDKGQLLYNWKFEDPAKATDSFYVGIDTLWSLPQDLDGDTAEDWDLQVCPDGFCMNGLKAGVHGSEAPDIFDGTMYQTEHHVQFFPAVSPVTYRFTGTKGNLFGALMYCQSLSTGISDTVLVFGSWELPWDTLNPPPVRPIAGYLPKKSDFSISGDTVHYLRAGTNVFTNSTGRGGFQKLLIQSSSQGMRISFPGLYVGKQVSIYGLQGNLLWTSGKIASKQFEVTWNPGSRTVSPVSLEFVFVRLTWIGGEAWGKNLILFPH